MVERGLLRLQPASMNSITACFAASRVGKRLRWHISFFRVAKKDSATALSRRLPVRLQESRTSLARARSAKVPLVYRAPLSELSRNRLSSDYAEKNAKPQISTFPLMTA